MANDRFPRAQSGSVHVLPSVADVTLPFPDIGSADPLGERRLKSEIHVWGWRTVLRPVERDR